MSSVSDQDSGDQIAQNLSRQIAAGASIKVKTTHEGRIIEVIDKKSKSSTSYKVDQISSKTLSPKACQNLYSTAGLKLLQLRQKTLNRFQWTYLLFSGKLNQTIETIESLQVITKQTDVHSNPSQQQPTSLSKTQPTTAQPEYRELQGSKNAPYNQIIQQGLKMRFRDFSTKESYVEAVQNLNPEKRSMLLYAAEMKFGKKFSGLIQALKDAGTSQPTSDQIKQVDADYDAQKHNRKQDSRIRY